MVRIENHCVGCDTLGKPCLGNACRYAQVAVTYCDKCDEECGEDVYDVDGEELCEECLKDMFRRKE